jgi:predicted nucleotidyltransferase
MNAQFAIPQERVTDFCRRWQIAELALFGYVLGDDFHPDSDLDVLVSFQPEARHTLFDMVRMQEELGRLFGRKVNLVSRRGIENSQNYIRRRAILESAEVVYGS